MKDVKMLSFRIKSSKHFSFKKLCEENNTTMKDFLTKVIDLTLEANQKEKNGADEQSTDLLGLQI